MFSQTTEYALRASVALATARTPQLTTAQIAEETQVPIGYLSKVLQGLVRAGIVNATRGAAGGYRLASDAHELRVLDVVNAVEPLRRIDICPLGLPEHEGELCPLHREIDAAVAHIECAFGSKTLADMIDPRDAK